MSTKLFVNGLSTYRTATHVQGVEKRPHNAFAAPLLVEQEPPHISNEVPSTNVAPKFVVQCPFAYNYVVTTINAEQNST